MNTHAQALRAYTHAASPTKTLRSAEYEVLARVTRGLRDAAKKGRRNFPALVAALDENRKLWTAFATDVSGKGNALPSELRAQIFYLSEFTVAHTREILNGRAHVGPLLEINISIMRGLAGQAASK